MILVNHGGLPHTPGHGPHYFSPVRGQKGGPGGEGISDAGSPPGLHSENRFMG